MLDAGYWMLEAITSIKHQGSSIKMVCNFDFIIMSITQELINIVKPRIENMGYEFVELKYIRRGRDWLLQVFADKEGGLTVTDCKTISEHLNYELDSYPDLLKHPYSMEVSSPGLDRSLKTEADFKRYINRDIEIKFYTPVDNYRIWSGKILEVRNENLVIEDKEGKYKNVSIDNIARANLKVEV